MKILVTALVAGAAALAIGLGVGATQFGSKAEPAQFGTKAEPTSKVGPAATENPAAARRAAKRSADCRRDALSDRSSDDPVEARENDGCLGESSEDDSDGDDSDSGDR